MEYLFKTLVIGDATTGKTSFIQRYVKNTYTDGYKFTVGVDFALKVVPWSKDEVVRLQLWDIAGQERFSRMTHIYYKDASACVICFDITARQTFDNVAKWKADLDSKVLLPNKRPVPCILLANKADNPKHLCIPDHEIAAKCKELGFIAWFPVSSKENLNVAESMNCLIKHILQEGNFSNPATTAPSSSVVKVTAAPNDSPPPPPESMCACFK